MSLVKQPEGTTGIGFKDEDRIDGIPVGPTYWLPSMEALTPEAPWWYSDDAYRLAEELELEWKEL